MKIFFELTSCWYYAQAQLFIGMAPNNNNSDDTLFSDNNDTTTNLNIKDITENMSSESKMIDTNPEKILW